MDVVLQTQMNTYSDYYKSLYKDNEVNEYTLEAALRMISLLERDILKGKKVLEAGCGNGDLGRLIEKNLKAKVIGMDFSESGLKYAKSIGLKTVKGDLQKTFPFKNASFDIVFAGQVIEHLLDPDFFLKECHRVLKPRGKLILTTPNLATWFNRFLFLFGVQPFFTEVSTIDKTVGLSFTRRLTSERAVVGHIRVFTVSALNDILILHKFKPIKRQGYSGKFFPKWLQMFDDLFSGFVSLASNMYVVSIKK